MLIYTGFLTSSLRNVLQQDGLSVDAMRQEIFTCDFDDLEFRCLTCQR